MNIHIQPLKIRIVKWILIEYAFDLTLTLTKNWMYIQFAFVLLFDECLHSIWKIQIVKRMLIECAFDLQSNENWMHIQFTFVLLFD